MDLSVITEHVLVGTTPSTSDFARLREMGVGLVINMRLWFGRPPSDGKAGPQYLRLRTFDSPLLPIPSAALVRGTKAALEIISGGGRVYAHCSRGRHRSVAMAAAILIAQGMPAEAAMQLIKDRRPAADPEAGHIRPRILEFERDWQRRHSADSAR